MAINARQLPQQRKPAPAAKLDTKEFRRWEGVNVRDSRTGIGDTEFSWLQNMVPIGSAALHVVNAPAAPIGSYAPGLGRMWGFTLKGTPVLIAIGLDGSIHQWTTATGAHKDVAAVGTVTKDAWITIWQDGPLLIVDPVKGYFTWDDTTFTPKDATQKGTSIAVFEGRVWISEERTIKWSAPNSFENFGVADGGGFSTLSDSVFQGPIRVLVSALQTLWVFGASAINAISNVVSIGAPPTVITSFSITNIVANVGTALPASVMGYFRAVAFSSAFGQHALSGVTPQKISEKLDSLNEVTSFIEPYFDQPTATVVINDNLVLCWLVNYNGRELYGVPPEDCPAPILVCFLQGKWFFAYQGRLKWITTVVPLDGNAQTWGHDGTNVFQCFGPDECAPIYYKAQSKLYDFGSAVTEKALMKIGLELRAGVPLRCTCRSIACIQTAICPTPGVLP